uniref:Protein kinase domain-containing protein n=1 Tax=Setaria digitata TaxID=48799 RepID=A0A915Q5S5_9BILA
MCQSDTMAYIVMEYIEGGELFTRITAKENHGAGLGENLTKFYAWQLFGALEYLHTNGIVHRDIKPENILLLKKDAYTVAKLTDFGLSRITERSLKTLCGTQIYMAPEIWKAVHYGCKVDVWALGVLIFASLCGYPPFSPDYKDWTLEQQILRGRLVFYKRWNNISVSAREFVRHCLKVDPEKRFSASQALSDKWFQDPIIDEANRVVQSYIVSIPSGTIIF